MAEQHRLGVAAVQQQVSGLHECDTWDPSPIFVGENRLEAFSTALQQADFGLLLLSVAWLGKFGPTGDLCELVVENSKPVIPVVLVSLIPNDTICTAWKCSNCFGW